MPGFHIRSALADPGFVKGGGGIIGLQAKKGGPGGGPTLGPMLKSLQRGLKGGGQAPWTPPPPLGSAHGGLANMSQKDQALEYDVCSPWRVNWNT